MQAVSLLWQLKLPSKSLNTYQIYVYNTKLSIISTSHNKSIFFHINMALYGKCYMYKSIKHHHSHSRYGLTCDSFIIIWGEKTSASLLFYINESNNKFFVCECNNIYIAIWTKTVKGARTHTHDTNTSKKTKKKPKLGDKPESKFVRESFQQTKWIPVAQCITLG